MKWFIFFLFLFLALLLESTLTTLPLVFIVLLCSAVVFRTPLVFVWSFVSGILLDSVTLHPVGVSSIFFLLFLGIAGLYERKFETQTIPFIAFLTFVGSSISLWIEHADYIFIESLISSGISIGLFFVYKYI